MTASEPSACSLSIAAKSPFAVAHNSRPHQPVGKIQAGFVCQSHHPKIPAATMTNPILWLAVDAVDARLLRSLCLRGALFKYGLMIRSVKCKTSYETKLAVTHQYRRMRLGASAVRLTSTRGLLR